MPVLNPDILFEIGKKFNKDGDVMKFILSGKEPLQAVKKFYASVKHLELHQNHFVIRWETRSLHYDYKSNFPLLKFLMSCVAYSTISLHIYYSASNSHRANYQAMIDKMIARKRLVKFSISAHSYYSATLFLDKFLPHFAATLKDVTIPSFCMTPKFRDYLNLDSLTILDSACYRLFSYCCKTSSLTFAYTDSHPLPKFDDFVSGNRQLSPSLVLIKQLIFNHKTILYQLNRDGFEDLMKYFPSLELIKFYVTPQKIFDIHGDTYISANGPYFIRFYTEIISTVFKVPPKVVIVFNSGHELVSLERCKQICDDFEIDESCKDFCCFRKIIPSASPESTILEVHFPK